MISSIKYFNQVKLWELVLLVLVFSGLIIFKLAYVMGYYFYTFCRYLWQNEIKAIEMNNKTINEKNNINEYFNEGINNA